MAADKFEKDLHEFLNHASSREEAELWRAELMRDAHSSTLSSASNRALQLQAQGKLDEAEPLMRECLRGSRETLGDAHPDTIKCIGNLAQLLYTRAGPQGPFGFTHAFNELGEAESLLRECLHAARTTLGDAHAETQHYARDLEEIVRYEHEQREMQGLPEPLRMQQASSAAAAPLTGVVVVLKGLVSAADLNGARAAAGSFDPAKVRKECA